jgi:hypothetical protein
MTTARHQLDLAMTEAQWQATVVELATRRGWLTYHVHDPRRSNPGFPDLVLVKERVVFAELKAQKGRLTEQQSIWQIALRVAGAEAYCWRPSDWPQVEQTLRRRAEP